MKMSDQDLGIFRKLLADESGFFFDSHREGRLGEAVFARMREKKIASPSEYYRFLQYNVEGGKELRLLIESLTVGETFFMRNEPQFEVFSKYILPKLIQKNAASRSIRIWSAGCSTGEEPYSIAIHAMNALPDYAGWNVSILATDINQRHLELARRGEYSARSVGLIPAPWLEAYFEKRGQTYVLNSSVKSRIEFVCHNLVRDPFSYPAMRDLDVLFCRNVTIYFDLETTKSILSRFADCLIDGGYLFIGHSETLWQLTDKFVPIEFPRTFIYQKQTGKKVSQADVFSDLPETGAILPSPSDPDFSDDGPAPAAPAAASVKSTAKHWEAGRKALNEKRYDEALALFESIGSHDPHFPEAKLAVASIRANREEYGQAADILKKIVASNNLSCEAYYLLGVVYSKMLEYKKSVEAFRKAVYVDPECALAYFYLGNIYRHLGHPGQADREYQNALSALKNKPDDEPVRFSEEIFSGYLRTACERNLRRIHA